MTMGRIRKKYQQLPLCIPKSSVRQLLSLFRGTNMTLESPPSHSNCIIQEKIQTPSKSWETTPMLSKADIFPRHPPPNPPAPSQAPARGTIVSGPSLAWPLTSHVTSSKAPPSHCLHLLGRVRIKETEGMTDSVLIF